ncbi:mitochondrial import inner membrane translocase subunit Tim17-A isoform X2 [Lontra canadensis]|uniref:mitochondrial import inner membrane translocase subunit Tim17-A isoform X2 n=1 Tax=Lontra canadensis TaxID=76717 RepID=UPI0013F36197|nr:mitochondrial import inner membrane translocase subunit Tim17-A isoform X2 [Lontra canadensis]
MEEYAREPCPWRIVDDCGGAFTMGTIGGGVFQAIKGFRNSPVGVNHRLRGSLTAIKTRAPQLGGPQFAEDPSQLPSAQLPSSPFGDYRQYQ